MPKFDPHPARRPTIVTGASSGIGRATAVALAAAGFPVALGARRVDRCEETAAEIRDAGGEAVALALDLVDPESIAGFVTAADAALGPIEVLISNAGEVRPVTVAGADPAEFRRQLAVNLLGPQALLHHLVPGMVERRRGDVVLVTSEVARAPRPHVAGYVASKVGLEGLAAALRMELEGSGVRVGVIRPGQTQTEQGTGWDQQATHEAMEAWIRWGALRHGGYLRPADVAAAVVAMVSVPRGTMFTELEVQPEPPIEAPATTGEGA